MKVKMTQMVGTCRNCSQPITLMPNAYRVYIPNIPDDSPEQPGWKHDHGYWTCFDGDRILKANDDEWAHATIEPSTVHEVERLVEFEYHTELHARMPRDTVLRLV